MLSKVKGYFKPKDAIEAKPNEDDMLIQEIKFLRERADHWCAIATDLRIRMDTMRARISENKSELGMRSNSLLAWLESLCKDPKDDTQNGG